MSSKYSNQNITFTGTLSRPSTTKGSILAHDGNSAFVLAAPTADGQNLTTDSSETSGVIWSAGVQGIAFGFAIPNADFPAEGSVEYFLVTTDATNPPGMVLPTSSAIFFSVRPNNIDGWADTVTNITGGTIDFALGFVAADTQQIAANFTAYSGSPQYQINGTDINTAPNKWRTFTTTIDIDVTGGQQVCMRVTNNLTSSADPTYTTEINPFIIFRA